MADERNFIAESTEYRTFISLGKTEWKLYKIANFQKTDTAYTNEL